MLVYYRSKEEALQAKLGLEKSPFVNSTNIQVSFASEKTLATFSDQHTPSHTYSHAPSGRMDSSSSWLPSDPAMMVPPSPQQKMPTVGSKSSFNTAMTPSRQEHQYQQQFTRKDSTSSVWSREFSAPGGPVPVMSGSSSVWSSGGILPGISSPWGMQSSNTNTVSEGGGVGGGVEDTSALTGTSPSMSTFLPNGLF